MWRGWVGDVALTLAKHYAGTPDDDAIVVRYVLEHDAATTQTPWFAVECNLAFLAGSAPDRYYEFETATSAAPDPALVGDRNLGSRGTLAELRAVTLVDGYSRLRVRLSSTVPFACWRFPVETVSLAERRRERTYQASALYCHWRPTLAPGARFATTLALTVTGW